MHTIPPHKRISIRFKTYNRDMKDVWSSFLFIDSYAVIIREKVKAGELQPFALQSLSGTSIHGKGATATFGIADHIVRVANPERSFTTAVALTEDFLKDLMVTVLEEFPEKMLSAEAPETPDRQQKLLDLIIAKQTKQEILSALIEERVRGLFYGNPTDFFLRDKRTRLEFRDHFEKNHSINLEFFAEITARRNLFAHNRGRVDAKYLREVPNAQLKANQKAIIEKTYLRHSIVVLRGLASVAAKLVNQRVFKQSQTHGKLKLVVEAFESRFDDKTPRNVRPV